MSKREELLIKIEKKEEQIKKIEKKIAKYEAKKTSEKEFIKEYGWLTHFEENKDYYKEQFIKDCDYEIRYAEQDLRNNQNTLENYKSQLEKIINFEKEDKIQVLVDFLNEWKENAYNWYIENSKRLVELRKNYESELETYLDSYINRYGDFNSWSHKYRTEKQFEKDYYSSINQFTFEITSYIGRVDTSKLKKALEEEATRKYKDLVKRITEKSGEIVDISKLKIAANGDLNGVVIGKKNKVEVETISAGGYNIQCFHYRVLVKVLK
jgi:hypothetical protein